MNVEGRWRRTIEVDPNGSVIVLDQARLPYAIEWIALTSVAEVARAIRDMHVRGAPLIGVTAAYGVAIATRTGVPIDAACAQLAETRPTAINLRWALDEMRGALAGGADPFTAAAKIADNDVAACEAIGGFGKVAIAALGKARVNVLTHCNAGWLATVDWGTALSPVYKAHEAGIPVHVWVEETRPRNQGMLTAWELLQHGVPHTVIADNAGGHLMMTGQVDAVIVGTDRVTANGDVCNKIGTYLKALAAKDNDVPFYVALPYTTFDAGTATGADVPIEERSADEVTHVSGEGGSIRVTASDAANPAFDVTPARLVTGYLTERGLLDRV